MPIKRKMGETKADFISRCIPIEINNGQSQEQAGAICYAYWEEKQLSAVKNIRKNRNFKKEFESFEKLRVYVDSSNADRMMWDSETKQLVVRFHDGSTYTYDDISQETFDAVIEGLDAPKTTGSNEYGSWVRGQAPSVGATLYKRIVKKDKGSKGGSFR
jgi:hypothetical protein